MTALFYRGFRLIALRPETFCARVIETPNILF